MDELSVGSKAPDFELPATTGNKIGLSGYLDKSDVILFFVREYN